MISAHKTPERLQAELWPWITLFVDSLPLPTNQNRSRQKVKCSSSLPENHAEARQELRHAIRNAAESLDDFRDKSISGHVVSSEISCLSGSKDSSEPLLQSLLTSYAEWNSASLVEIP